MTWKPATARDLKQRDTYVIMGGFLAQARTVETAPAPGGGAVAFASAALWGRPGEQQPSGTTLAADATVYILACTCNGMSFIGNRWVFTGLCSCVHHPLPKES